MNVNHASFPVKLGCLLPIVWLHYFFISCHRLNMVSGGSGIRSMEVHSSNMGSSMWLTDGKFPPTTCTANHGTNKALEWSMYQNHATFHSSLRLPWYFLKIRTRLWNIPRLQWTCIFIHDWFHRQSQSPGWVGGFGSQSAQASASANSVVSNLTNFNMTGYQTQWAGPNTSPLLRRTSSGQTIIHKASVCLIGQITFFFVMIVPISLRMFNFILFFSSNENFSVWTCSRTMKCKSSIKHCHQINQS